MFVGDKMKKKTLQLSIVSKYPVLRATEEVGEDEDK